MSIEENLNRLLEAIEEAALQAGRNPEEIKLVAVTKECTPQMMQEAYELGIRDFGENRVQDALEKMPQLPSDIRWHFIGHLQKNKVSKVVGQFSLIHSVDSLELAQKLGQVSREKGVGSSILLEANTSGEKTKRGLSPTEWKETFPSLLDVEGIEILGLMTMAPLTEEEGVIRHTFSELRFLRDDLQSLARGRALLETLSMGMSNDFRIAIQEGATLLRIGSALFDTIYQK